jgi:hypothetical protein
MKPLGPFNIFSNLPKRIKLKVLVEKQILSSLTKQISIQKNKPLKRLKIAIMKLLVK